MFERVQVGTLGKPAGAELFLRRRQKCFELGIFKTADVWKASKEMRWAASPAHGECRIGGVNPLQSLAAIGVEILEFSKLLRILKMGRNSGP